jgi:uncharacterized SAM-binding protein YcdF (DUF218 family)
MFNSRKLGVRWWQREGLKRLWRLRLIQRRTLWCPTWYGLVCMIVLLGIPVAWWWSFGESFLSLNRRLPAEVLVVEGWIGHDGIQAAEKEFEQHGYQYIVASGGSCVDRWIQDRSSYAEMAGRELVKLGVPPDKIIVAPATEAKSQRTYASALAVCRTLHARGLEPNAANVFTYGPHARRSRLVFAKALRMKIGVVDWMPSGDAAVPWWRSSERAKDLLTETAGYFYEALFNSGRDSNLRGECVSRDSVQLP